MTDLARQFASALTDRYAIERELGAGGMATVFLAHDTRHDRKVALKVLRPELAAVIGAERFLAEIKTTANLQHPHILPLFDSGQVGGTVFYVMPFVSGETLRDRLNREKQLPIDDAIRIAKEVAAALDYAHRHGVIHRDIKPENILLHDGQALVADFGIALAASKVSDTRMTETGMSLGTPMYMSPEQAMGERNLDARTDVYALGCVLFEMLAGEPPFTGPTAQSIVAKVLTEDPRSVSGLRRSVPAHVDAAVAGALEKLPADRIATARAFADAIEGRASGTVAHTTRGAVRAARPIARHPLVMALGAAVVALSSVVVWQTTRSRPAPSSPVIRHPLELPSDAQLAIYSLTGPNIAISPDGRTVVFTAEGVDGSRKLFLRPADDIEARPVPSTEGASQPSFSPDGRSVAYLAGGRLMRVALDGSGPQTVTQLPDVAGHVWARSGMIVFPHPQQAHLMIIPPTGGTARALTQIDTASGERQQQYPVNAGDGEHVLYSSWGTGGAESVRIGVASLSTGRSVRLDLAGVTPIGTIDEFVIYATTNNDLLAAPVDLAAGRVLGPPVLVASGVMIGAAGAAKAALSSTGSLVYLGGARSAQLVLANFDGKAQPVIAESKAYGYPRFSPDGKRIALTIASGPTSDVWLYDVASRTSTRLTSGGSVNERPEWTPDGSRVLFRTDRSGVSSIWWQRVDHSEQGTALLSGGRQGNYFEAVVSPDGKYVAFQNDTSGADVEYRALQGDSTSRPIARSQALEHAHRISPDGRWIAFVTDESGSRQVVVQPFPGPGPRVQISTNGGAEPVWSRDGRRLFYRGARRFVVADVVTAPAFAVKSRTELLDDVFQPAVSPHANYDVSPDGSRLLLLKGTDSQRLIVVHNWADEVRARLRTSPR